jgi:hypothetical protein
MERAKREGARVYLLTIESLLGEDWPRKSLDEVFAVPNFHDRRALLNAVSYLARSRNIDHIVAMDDFDVEVASCLREHFRLPGMNDSTARLFRDKLAMRVKAAELGIPVPAFTGVFNYDRLRDFLARVPPPYLLKPRSQASAAGIRRIRTSDELWRELDRLGDEQSHMVLEQFVAGDLFHVDSLVAGGQVVFAEVNGYLRPLLDVYQGGGVYATRTVPRQQPVVAELRQLNESVLTGFGLTGGASHTEFLKAHDDGRIILIETSARVGGANTAEMVEAATGVNLWEEWAAIELARTGSYRLPAPKDRYGGVVLSLTRQEWPDSSPFADPEIVYRLKQKQHIGLVVGADNPNRIQELVRDYIDRIQRDYTLVLPPADKVSH